MANTPVNWELKNILWGLTDENTEEEIRQKVFELIRDTSFFPTATVNNGQPENRLIDYNMLPDGELYFIDEGDNTLRCVMGTDGEKEEDFEWSVESGVIGFEDSEHKYLSHFVFRAALAPGACLHLDILYDEDKAWTKRGTYNNCGLRSFVLPVMPRRCDHLRFRLRGKGEMKLYSIAKIKEKGSDAAWR